MSGADPAGEAQKVLRPGGGICREEERKQSLGELETAADTEHVSDREKILRCSAVTISIRSAALCQETAVDNLLLSYFGYDAKQVLL